MRKDSDKVKSLKEQKEKLIDEESQNKFDDSRNDSRLNESKVNETIDFAIPKGQNVEIEMQDMGVGKTET